VLAELTLDPGRAVTLAGDDVTRPAVLTTTHAGTVDAIPTLHAHDQTRQPSQ